jgi:hypothetical protein
VPQLVACPACGRLLESVGVLSMGHVDVRANKSWLAEYPTYQCPSCMVTRSFGGMTAEVSLCFLADEGGRALDPQTMEPFPFGPAPGVN